MRVIIRIQYIDGGEVDLAGPVDTVGQPFLPRAGEFIRLQLGTVMVTNLVWDFTDSPDGISLVIYVKPDLC